jgi:HEAT repeat protein
MQRALGMALLLVFLTAASEPPSNADDEELLKKSGVKADGPSILEFFRKRTLSQTGQQRIAALIRQLGDDSFQARERASHELVAVGTVATPFLQTALRSSDIEVARRAEECLRLIEDGEGRAGLAAAVARTLAARKPAGALEVLLAYLPFAENESVAYEVHEALASLGVQNGKAQPALLGALNDPEPLRRSAAGAALCHAGTAARYPEIRRLLQDSDTTVRLQGALALATAQDKEAIPALIQLLDDLPLTRAWQAENFLLSLPGDDQPTVALTRDPASRRRARDAWLTWWQHHGPQIDLAKIPSANRPKGYTLLVMLDVGRIVELGADEKPRLQVDGIDYPLDAQILPGDRILSAEYHGDRVTERNRKGEIIWEKHIDQPLVAQRLANGNTFIATQVRCLEIDREGHEVTSFVRPPGEFIMKAQKMPNGDIACITLSQQVQQRRFVRMDPTGKDLSSFPVNVSTSGGRVDVLSNGHVLIPEKESNRVVECDAHGRVVWQVPFLMPVAAVRLPNGNTLVTSFKQNRAVELDREGKEVWEFDAGMRVTRAFRR